MARLMTPKAHCAPRCSTWQAVPAMGRRSPSLSDLRDRAGQPSWRPGYQPGGFLPFVRGRRGKDQVGARLLLPALVGSRPCGFHDLVLSVNLLLDDRCSGRAGAVGSVT